MRKMKDISDYPYHKGVDIKKMVDKYYEFWKSKELLKADWEGIKKFYNENIKAVIKILKQ